MGERIALWTSLPRAHQPLRAKMEPAPLGMGCTTSGNAMTIEANWQWVMS